MSPKFRKMMHKLTKRHELALIWIDIKYDFLEWFYNATWEWRFKHSKFITITSMAYTQEQMTWDDIEIEDQWGHFLPLGCGIVSKKNWEFDQQINRDIGVPEEPWQDFVDGDWPTYYYQDDYLNSNHYIDAVRKNLKRKLIGYDTELHLNLKYMSQKHIDDEETRWKEWSTGGPKKIVFTEGAKDSLKEILGDADAQGLFDEIDDRNKDVDSKEDK